jgi:ribosome modulation factor
MTQRQTSTARTQLLPDMVVGYHAFKAGTTRGACPHPGETLAGSHWLSGWDFAQSVTADDEGGASR